MPRQVSSSVTQTQQKWVNVVFDLNKVLCEFLARSSARGVRAYEVHDIVFFYRVSTLIGMKAVYVHPPMCGNF